MTQSSASGGNIPCCAAAAGLLCGASGLKYAIAGRSSQVFGPSVYRGPGRRRTISLTFDDGPSPGSRQIAGYLARESIRATFFQCGANVVRHPRIAGELQAAGHEIGNHTFSHARLCPRLGWKMNLLSREQIFREFAAAQEAILRHTGEVPRLLRAPYGLRWRGMRKVQRELGLLGVMWTVIGNDWEWPAERIAKHVLRRASQGGIICLHDGRDTQPMPDISATLRALQMIVPALRARGYEFETVSEILLP